MNLRAGPIFLIFALAHGCAYKVEKEVMVVQPSFQSIRANIFEPRCAQCHSDWISNYSEVSRLTDAIAQRITSTDPDFTMPPPGSAALTDSERTAILQWIKLGAPEQSPPRQDNI
jgi:uncharacterized membrane protein